jgi:hypothetical protein
LQTDLHCFFQPLKAFGRRHQWHPEAPLLDLEVMIHHAELGEADLLQVITPGIALQQSE